MSQAAQVAASEERARVKCPEAFESGTALQSAMYDVAFHFDQTKPGWRNQGDWPEQLIEIITHYAPRPEWHAARLAAGTSNSQPHDKSQIATEQSHVERRLAEMKAEEEKILEADRFRAAPQVFQTQQAAAIKERDTQQQPQVPNQQEAISQAAEFSRIKTLAEKGNAEAEGYLGSFFAKGKGVQKDLDEAVRWYRKAALHGDAKAQCALGNCFADGEGVARNPEDAAKWYYQAAKQGLAIAQYNLSLSYAEGAGVQKSAGEAARWLRAAADQGLEAAQVEQQKASRLAAEQQAAHEALLTRQATLAKSSTKPGFDPTTAQPTGFEDLGAVTEQPERAEKTAESAQVNTSGTHPPSAFNARENPADVFRFMVIIVCAVLFPITVIAAYKAIAARNDTPKLSTPDVSTNALREQQSPDSSVLIEMVNAKVRHYRRRSNICFVIAVAVLLLLYATGGFATKDSGLQVLLGIACLPVFALIFAAFVYAAKCRGRSWAWALLVPLASVAVGAAGPVVAGRVGFWIGTLLFCLAMWFLPKRTEAMLAEARTSLGSQPTPVLQKAAENFLSKMDRAANARESPAVRPQGLEEKPISYIWYVCDKCGAENCATAFFAGTRKPCCHCGRVLVVPGSRPDNEHPSHDRQSQPDTRQTPSTPSPMERVIEGDGSRETPFVIHTSDYAFSALLQNRIIDGLFGSGAWVAQQRRYSTSQRGESGNEDLCEHLVTVAGQLKCVWFDLYLVTKLANDPGLNEAKRNLMESPSMQQAIAQVRDELYKPALATPPDPPLPTKQTTAENAMFGLSKPKKKPLEACIDEKTKAIYINADSFNKNEPLSNIVRVTGQNATVDLTAFVLVNLLALAKMHGWSGADGLFRHVPNGNVVLELHDGQAVTSSEASDLARWLTNSPLNKQEAENTFFDTITPLAAIAASGGFTMQLF